MMKQADLDKMQAMMRKEAQASHHVRRLRAMNEELEDQYSKIARNEAIFKTLMEHLLLL